MNTMLFLPPKYLLQALLLIFSALILSLSHEAAAQSHLCPTEDQRGMIDERGHDVVSWGVRRSVLEKNSVDLVENSSMILAAIRTHRRDPLDHFNYYKGGWNISEFHYFSSVAFTAISLFVIGAIWFLGFGLCLLVICIRHCCYKRQHFGYSPTVYMLSLIFLTTFTIAAIVGCVVLYTGQGKFHGSTTGTLKYVVKQANSIVKKLRTVSDYLSAAKHIGIDQMFLPPNVQDNIDKVDKKINASAHALETETGRNSKDIQRVLDIVRRALICISAGMLLLAILGFLFSVFGMQSLMYIVVIIGWILITITVLLCCLFVILHNVVADSCAAMDEWVQHPTAHTALDDIIPCMDTATAEETLNESKEVTIQLVGVVNTFIKNVSNMNYPPNAGSFYYNQSGPLVPVLCNPYNPDKTDRKCSSVEVNFSNAAQEWRKYICQVSESGICTTVGRLTPAFYDQIVASANVSHGLYRYGPFLVQLGNCTIVRETFGNIIKDHCPNLRLYSKWIYIGLSLASTAVMLSVIFWLFHKRQRQHRAYTKHSIASAQDHSGGEKSM